MENEKLAILTDIHGNSSALAAVLEDVDTRDIDHIYCLGDVIGIGPDSNESCGTRKFTIKDPDGNELGFVKG